MLSFPWRNYSWGFPFLCNGRSRDYHVTFTSWVVTVVGVSRLISESCRPVSDPDQWMPETYITKYNLASLILPSLPPSPSPPLLVIQGWMCPILYWAKYVELLPKNLNHPLRITYKQWARNTPTHSNYIWLYLKLFRREVITCAIYGLREWGMNGEWKNKRKRECTVW